MFLRPFTCTFSLDAGSMICNKEPIYYLLSLNSLTSMRYLQPNRVKHSNRVFCRCTFEIKWLNPELNGETVTIPSKSIMKLSREEIDSHPIFAAFLNALTPTDGRETSSPLLFLEETDYDADLQGVLEEQIEQISKFADESIESSADLLEFKRGMHRLHGTLHFLTLS